MSDNTRMISASPLEGEAGAPKARLMGGLHTHHCPPSVSRLRRSPPSPSRGEGLGHRETTR